MWYMVYTDHRSWYVWKEIEIIQKLSFLFPFVTVHIAYNFEMPKRKCEFRWSVSSGQFTMELCC